MAISGTNYPEVMLDEICLEGLDGITLQGLWIRLAERFDCVVPNNLKIRFWKIIVHLKDVDFFELPEPRADLVPFKRYEKINDKFVLKILPRNDDPQSELYPYHPVNDGYGSCLYFETRRNISAEVRQNTFDETIDKWGNKLVIVGTLEARWKALAPNSPPVFDLLSKSQFCILERIGRTRYNGETSVGPLSGTDIDDPKKLFYCRKNLMSHKLIIKRPFLFRDGDSSLNCLLVHLTRFQRTFLSNIEHIIEGIVEYLKNRPGNIATYPELKSFIARIDNSMNFKTVIKFSEFSKIAKNTIVKYEEIYPNTSQKFSNLNDQERFVRVVKLRDPNDSNEGDDTNQDEQDMENFDVKGSGYVGESLLQQAYRVIYETGSEGVTQRSLAQILGLQSLTSRAVLKHFTRHNMLHMSLVEIWRQRTSKYMCPEFVGEIKEEFEAEKERKKHLSLQSKSIPNFTPNIENITVHSIEGSSHDTQSTEDVNNDENDTCEVNENTLKKIKPMSDLKTLKNLRRVNMILEQLRERHIIHEISNLMKYCNRQEILSGFNYGTIDKRSIMRIVRKLEEEGLLRVIQIKLGAKYHNRKLTFLCEPHIDASHSYIQSVVEQARIASCGQREKKITTESMMRKPKYKQYFHAHKFVKMDVLHKFLFYIIYEHKNKPGNIEELLPKSTLDSLNLSSSEISTVYENAPDKYLFVPPVPTHANWPTGWMFLADILLCMPLHVFIKVVQMPSMVPNLLEYVKHPIKSQILVKNLPKELQNILFFKRRFIFSIYDVLERLCMFGLVRFGARIMKEKERIFIYVNKNASVLDTTVSSPCYTEIEEREYVREFFKFDSFKDVEYYWNRVKHICTNTPMGLTRVAVGKQVEFQSPEVKMAHEMRSYSIEEATQLDNGTVPGDGRGAAGFDSSLYSHLKRSWLLNELPIKPVQKIEAERSAIFLPKIVRKRRNVFRTINILNSGVTKKGKFYVRTVTSRKPQRSKPKIDEIDKLALRNLASHRSSWQPKEDRIILLALTAGGIFYPNSRNVPASTIRDMLHYGTRIKNKTSASCRRRLLYMRKKTQISRNADICLAEVKQNTYILEKYSQIYSALYVKESSEKYNYFIKESTIHFIELIHYLHRLMYNKTAEKLSFFNVPQSLNELLDKYTVLATEPAPKTNIPHPEPSNIEEIQYSMIQNTIHIALSCGNKKQCFSHRLLHIYRQFHEDVLREAIQRLKSSGMIAITKKHKMTDSSTRFSSLFHLSQHYVYQICAATPYQIFSETYAQYKFWVTNSIENFSPQNLDSGTVILLIELNSYRAVHLSLKIPNNILIIDPKKLSKIDGNVSSNNLESSSTLMEEEKNITLMTPCRFNLSSLQNMEVPPAHAQDHYAVNTCELIVRLKNNPENIFYIPPDTVYAFLDTVRRDCVVGYDHTKTIDKFKCQWEDLKEKVFAYIDSKDYMGALNKDIKETFINYNIKNLEKILIELKNEQFVLRVGVVKSHWISKRHINSWFVKLPLNSKDLNTRIVNDLMQYDELKNSNKRKASTDTDEFPLKRMKIEDENQATSEDEGKLIGNSIKSSEIMCDLGVSKAFHKIDRKSDMNLVKETTYLCPRPWMKPDGFLNLRMLWRWSGAILTTLVSQPVRKFPDLEERFTFMSPSHLRLLCEMLCEIGCIKMFTISRTKTSLWSQKSSSTIGSVNILDDNENIYIEILDNALITLALYRGISIGQQKLEETMDRNVNNPSTSDLIE